VQFLYPIVYALTFFLQEDSKESEGNAEEIKKAEDALAAGKKVIAEAA
jgi:hypothetical protein